MTSTLLEAPTVSRQQIAAATAAELSSFIDSAPDTPVMIGFDGFVDSIIKVVDKRHSHEKFDSIDTIESFGKRIAAAAGKSSNYELVTELQKLGGNGPIMANAMAAAGLDVTYIGAVGKAAIEPAFEELAAKAKVHSISDPGFTDALEFEDGKLLLGKYDYMAGIDQSTIDSALGKDKYQKIIRDSKLLGMVNWTMLPGIKNMWEALADEILPQIKDKTEDKYVFIDLADPAKRTDSDIADAMKVLRRLNGMVRVVLGLNFAEAVQVSKIAGANISQDDKQIEDSAIALREKLDLCGVVIHPRWGAAASVVGDDGVAEHGCFQGPFVRQPKLSTGAGDNFNAGFCLGLLAGLNVEQALCAGTATSGFYVRNAKSPTLSELAEFCADLPGPE